MTGGNPDKNRDSGDDQLTELVYHVKLQSAYTSSGVPTLQNVIKMSFAHLRKVDLMR